MLKLKLHTYVQLNSGKCGTKKAIRIFLMDWFQRCHSVSFDETIYKEIKIYLETSFEISYIKLKSSYTWNCQGFEITSFLIQIIFLYYCLSSSTLSISVNYYCVDFWCEVMMAQKYYRPMKITTVKSVLTISQWAQNWTSQRSQSKNICIQIKESALSKYQYIIERLYYESKTMENLY